MNANGRKFEILISLTTQFFHTLSNMKSTLIPVLAALAGTVGEPRVPEACSS